MIESIEFTNFKALRKTTLPLQPFTLLLGPNGSGKTTVLQALDIVAARFRGQDTDTWPAARHVAAKGPNSSIEISLNLRWGGQLAHASVLWADQRQNGDCTLTSDEPLPEQVAKEIRTWLCRMQSFSLDPSALALPVPVSGAPLDPSGRGLAAVLDHLKDNHPERWGQLLEELRSWLPEYDHIGFAKPSEGRKGVELRTAKGRHAIPARELSQGTLVALALLSLAYMPEPPSVIGLEEIDRGLHPRLLRHLQDALYRLSYPESCGENRPPIQVIATTHSPYMLDLYRDHPEEVVLAQKEGLEVTMKRLSDVEHFEEILGDSPLSEVWYSGVLGGVSVKP